MHFIITHLVRKGLYDLIDAISERIFVSFDSGGKDFFFFSFVVEFFAIKSVEEFFLLRKDFSPSDN